jgi:hypothetical protein
VLSTDTGAEIHTAVSRDRGRSWTNFTDDGRTWTGFDRVATTTAIGGSTLPGTTVHRTTRNLLVGRL